MVNTDGQAAVHSDMTRDVVALTFSVSSNLFPTGSPRPGTTMLIVFDLVRHSDILKAVLLACSFEPATLNALRLVCTATKQAVVAFHCRAIRLLFVSQGPPSPANINIYLTTLDPLDLPREQMPPYALSPALAFSMRASIPPEAAFGIHPGVALALNHPAYVSVYLTDMHHDHFWSMQASPGQLAYHSPVQLLSHVECLLSIIAARSLSAPSTTPPSTSPRT